MKLVRGSPGSKSKKGTKRQTSFTQISTRYEPDTRSIWCWMQPTPLPCLNTTLIEELFDLQQLLTSTYQNEPADGTRPFHNLILASKIPGIFNLGGDLGLFRKYITSGDEHKLRAYAYKTIDLVASNINSLELPITTIALVRGQALGGGFETALSCDVIVAERCTQMGFPEILFNLFPGMGAYNLLERRIGPALTERIILSGETYAAEDLYNMGVVDVLADDGKGPEAVADFMRSHKQSHGTIRAIKKIRHRVNPITQESLYDIVDIWIEAAMALGKKDLIKMDRLLQVQKDTKSTRAIIGSCKGKMSRHWEWRRIADVEFPLMTHLGETITKDRRNSADRRQAGTTPTPP